MRILTNTAIWFIAAIGLIAIALIISSGGCGYSNWCSSAPSGGDGGSSGAAGNVVCDFSAHDYDNEKCSNAVLRLSKPNSSSIDVLCAGLQDVVWRADCALPNDMSDDETGKVFCDGTPFNVDPTCGATKVTVSTKECNREASMSTDS